MNKQKNFISAVIYVNNSETSINNFLDMLFKVLDSNFEKFEVICVDDASVDNSKKIIKEFSNKPSNVILSIVNMSNYQGVEAAMRAGIDLAIGDFIFEFDDISMDYEANIITKVYEHCIQGFDIVSCGKGNIRSSSKLFYSIFNRHSDTQYALRSETFRIISRRGINRVQSMSINLPYRKAIYSNCGLKIDYIDYIPIYNGDAYKQKHKNPRDTAITALVLFTNIAYKISLTFTLIMMLFTLSSIIYVFIVYLTGNPVAGYTTMMILISGAFFAMFAILAFIIKYLTIILGLIFHKHKYIIEGIEKVT